MNRRSIWAVASPMLGILQRATTPEAWAESRQVTEWIIGDYQQIEAISLAGFTLRTRAKATTVIRLMLHSPRSTIPT